MFFHFSDFAAPYTDKSAFENLFSFKCDQFIIKCTHLLSFDFIWRGCWLCLVKGGAKA
jgi:hypothetical protein